MFEKDAIDLANRKYPIPRVYNELNVARNHKYEEGFKDGAEFGYNKRNEQLIKAKEIIKKLYSHVFQGMGFMEINDYNVQKAEVEQFISKVEN